MQIYAISQFLADAGLASPDCRILNPNHENYTAFLLQPQGEIEADATGVRNADRDLARRQFSAFLADAAAEDVALAVTPEYSMPWEVLEASLRTGIVPRPGALWAIGCESVTLDQVRDFRERVSDIVTVLYEDIPPQQRRFLDPLAYIFSSRQLGGGDNVKLVMVIQFKTSPMAHDRHFEIDRLQTGNRLYCFGDGINQLRLATLICSDALVFLDEHARALYDRTLILHIQLNPKPRQEQFRLYRTLLMRYAGDQTELLCLNWAKDVHEQFGQTRKCWNNISGTAWYLRPDKFDRDDCTLTDNHRNGLYYTWLQDLRCCRVPGPQLTR